MDVAAVVVDQDAAALRVVLQAQHAAAAGEEVAGVIKGVEAEDVGVEHAAQQLLAPRERAEYLARGERGVQEHGDADLVAAPPQQRGQDHEVVVVEPDGVELGARDLDEAVRELDVGAHVRLPELGGEAAGGVGRGGEDVVQQGPELLLAEALVEAALEVGAEEDGVALEVRDEVVREPLREGCGVCWWGSLKPAGGERAAWRDCQHRGRKRTSWASAGTSTGRPPT